MSGEMERLVEQWKAQLPVWKRWIFTVLDKIGAYDLGYQLFGFDDWYSRR